jgi:hypothetical protein
LLLEQPPFDDQNQARIRLEAEAVLLSLSHFESGDWEWIGSEAMDLEIAESADEIRKTRVQLLMSGVDRSIEIELAESERSNWQGKVSLHSMRFI